MFFAALSTVYSCWWDFWYDWGLLRRNCKNWLLRDTLLYYSPAVYYVCMLLNVVLRYVWLLTISPGIDFDERHTSLRIFLFGMLEVLRRCMWNVFRVENEQLHNVGEFRAIKAVPLPDISGTRRQFSKMGPQMRLKSSHVAPVPPVNRNTPLPPTQAQSQQKRARHRSPGKEGPRKHC